MKKVLGLSLVAIMALSTASFAEDTKLKVSSNAALTSNYIWRGISYTAGTSAAQMGINLENLAGVSGLHFNVWGSGIKQGSEIDTILGYATKLGSIDADFGLINYSYTQDHIAGTFAGDTYAEAFVALKSGNHGLSIWQEIGHRDQYTAPSDFDGLTIIADTSFAGIDLSAGTRIDASNSNDSSYFGSIATSWDCLLIPTYTMGAMLAYNDSTFANTQSLFDTVGLTFALTLSKDF